MAQKVPLKLLLSILVIISISSSVIEAFINPYPRLKRLPLAAGTDAGEPLFLTPLIEAGKFEDARKQALVEHKEMSETVSYAGYLTVNKKYESNMFFWFFPAVSSPDASVVLWLQGGPGASSLYGLFTENGPWSVTKNKTLEKRPYSWNSNHHLLYIDNPVGTGYSFTKHDEGYATNETQVGQDLYEALSQFFTLFHEFRKYDFFITGESYAGKYVPALAYTIHEKNSKTNEAKKINLKGLAMGNGFTDPINQMNYGDYLYQIGLIDFNGMEQFHMYEAKGRAMINQSKFNDAFELFNKLLDGDLNSPPTLFNNLTGFQFYYNYLHAQDGNESKWMGEFIQRADVRRAIHVGNCSFDMETGEVEKHLISDIAQSQADKVALLMQHYKVLVYNGQLDIIVAYPLTVNYLRNLKWPNPEKYKKAVRNIWRVDNDIAGYTKTCDNLTEVLVRNAGHMVPSDQPKWAADLITRFTHGKKFSQH